MDDRNALYLVHLAAILHQGGQPEKALPYYSKLLNIDSKNKDIWLNQWQVFGDLRRFKDTINSYQKAIENNSKDGYTELGHIVIYCC